MRFCLGVLPSTVSPVESSYLLRTDLVGICAFLRAGPHPVAFQHPTSQRKLSVGRAWFKSVSCSYMSALYSVYVHGQFPQIHINLL